MDLDHGKKTGFQENICFCFTDYTKSFDCVDHNKLWEIIKEIRILNRLTRLLRNLYAAQEATVGTEHRTTNMFKTGKGVRQSCVSLPCLFNLYTEYITGNAMLDKAQVGIKIAGRNINNLRYSDAAAAAKSLQERLTLGDPIDGSPPGSSIPGILQAILIPACASSNPASHMMYSAN